ncbi:MAG: Tenuivirus NS-3 Protein [Bacteroidetes bacterium HLUCCA01]|nr:MAG: Tenuivirus NS-3 Protein [Bacteroidetes bacterium HLUCCA01]
MNRYLSKNELHDYGAGSGNTADQAHALLLQQKETWPMLRNGAATLDSVVSREIDFGHFSMKVQFNPGRIVSSSAKVDKKSIAERRCFLCEENLPPEQKGLKSGDYSILCNPFPIFPEHFTIPHTAHIDQRISGAFAAMLELTREMGTRYSLFYNGPKCGASAPDHLHFQAGTFGFMQIDTTWEHLVEHYGSWLVHEPGTRIAAVDDTLRRFLVIESDDAGRCENEFARIFEAFGAFNEHPGEEPMVNIVTSFRDGRWRAMVFLRRKHRPEQFFAEGEEQILFSPASVDFGGVCITPLERDFNRMNRELLTDMFSQLSVQRDVLDAVAQAVRAT